MEHIDQLINFDASASYKNQEEKLLLKHFQVISIDKNGTGGVKTSLPNFHKIHLKTN